ncbi:MAG: hypothetical protein J3Q66DRAFT_350865 [Benniella sp.]|nr:MAG: hypothetical protein J3Q66DRAFT_350865 [Benniella sp.]
MDVDVGPYDNAIATLLSGSRDGWRVVRACPSARFDREAMGALFKHSGTLEELCLEGNCTATSRDIVQVLRSCPNLHTLIYMESSYRWSSASSLVDGRVFIDLDPDTGSFKPWECENFLRVLKIRIDGISRQDEKGCANHDERHKIQGLVYDRLARLVSLEVLWIGGESSMSLESGLDRLSGLRKLKELYVITFDRKIGVKEVQWMTEHWPRLRVLCGLDKHWGDELALRWLQENHPGIEVETP